MFVKNCFCDEVDNALIYIPDGMSFEFRRRALDGLYLILPDREIMLRSEQYWSQNFTAMPDYAAEDLYDDIIDAITKMLQGDEPVRGIDIDTIEYGLIQSKYKAKWLSKGYITAEGRRLGLSGAAESKERERMLDWFAVERLDGTT